MDDILLRRWSTALQVTSILMIAAFFAALSHSTPRAELRWWVRAWAANLVALLVGVWQHTVIAVLLGWAASSLSAPAT